MNRILAELDKIIHFKINRLLIIVMLIFIIVTNLQSFVESALPNRVSSSIYSNFSNNTVRENNNSNNTLIENNKIGVQALSSIENGSDKLQNATVIDESKKNPRDNLNCYTEGLYVCNEFGECDN